MIGHGGGFAVDGRVPRVREVADRHETDHETDRADTEGHVQVHEIADRTDHPCDLTMPGMLHMKILFAERPHARVVRLDVSKAQVCPGVVAIFRAQDVPVNEYGLQQTDQPVLCGPGSGKPGADIVRFVGDQVALVVAETEKAAAAARNLIEIEFEDLPVVTDPMAAMRAESLLIHPERGDSNVCVHYRIRKGAVTEGFAQADVIMESEYRLPFQEHAYLQPEAGLAYIDEEGRVTVQVGGQWPHTDRAQIAHALGFGRRTGAGDLSGHRRGIRRARGHVCADRVGAGRVEAAPAGENRLEPPRIRSSGIANAIP